MARAMELFWRLNVARLLQEQEGRRRVGWEVGGRWGFQGKPGLSAGVIPGEMLCVVRRAKGQASRRCLDV